MINQYIQQQNPLLGALPTKRNVFISYYHGDQGLAQTFVNEFATKLRVFTPRALGLNYEPDRIQSSNPQYVMGEIRDHLIVGSSVNLVLIGTCTHSRRYVDWEIKRGLTNGNGLFGIILPPHTHAYLPDRFAANWNQAGTGYARLYYWPADATSLRGWIETAYTAICRQMEHLSMVSLMLVTALRVIARYSTMKNEWFFRLRLSAEQLDSTLQ